MKALDQFLLLSIAVLTLADSAQAKQPPDVVKSDSNDNTAMGEVVLSVLTSGANNTGAGAGALNFNTTGSDNTAFGAETLQLNTTGSYNNALGFYTLLNNTTGSYNSAYGSDALNANTTGHGNAAAGYSALRNNTTGYGNTASGSGALQSNVAGIDNSASGNNALFANTSGDYNTTSGYQALYANTTGDYHITDGYKAGFNLTTGSNNIDVGNEGMAAEADTIRIGTSATQKAAYIAGIYGTSVTGELVVVSSDGQLGVRVSSERFKTAIAPMGADTAKLAQLRPVTFHLKSDPHGALQYGLIAEEVARVYLELVIRDGSGRIDGVRHDELAPMLLNEVQQQQTHIAAQAEKIVAQGQQNAAQAAAIRDLQRQQIATRAEQSRMQQQLAELKTLNQATAVALRQLQRRDALMVQR